MPKFKESELNDVLKKYECKSNIEIGFENSLEGKICIEEADIVYDRNKGYIEINCKNGILKINTALVYGYELDNERIRILFDDLLLLIKKL